jgi:outer membrane protein assembly factor BamB/tetratricopeptide (TPR) repeat protein
MVNEKTEVWLPTFLHSPFIIHHSQFGVPMPFAPKPLVRIVGGVALAIVTAVWTPLDAQVAGPATQPGALDPLSPEAFAGKEPTEGVYVRDSAAAVEKWTLAQKMERLKEWNKSADLYQEVITKYADRVVPWRVDADNKICQYTSITNPVQERLAKWPREGLDVYRARYEIPAATLLENAGADDAATLNKVYNVYFVTDAAKAAGIRLIDLYMEDGEFPAAAWIGDRLLNFHPNLTVERPAVLYRTALAYYFAGDSAQAKAHLEKMRQQFPQERGIVRGKDVILPEALAADISAPLASVAEATNDSWPMVGGDPSRGRVSAAAGKPGARLYGIPLSKANYSINSSANRALFEQRLKAQAEGGLTLGVMPVTDRGELFFQDGQRLFGISLESGVPLPGWAQTYSDGAYTLGGVVGSPRLEQLSVTLTEHEVLAIMGQPDRAAMMNGFGGQTEPRLVCLDRASGKEKWMVALSQTHGLSDSERALHMAGSPLVIGDGVLVFASAQKQAGFEDAYVICFDLNTGKHRWSTYISSANASGAMWGAMAPSMSENASHLAYGNGRVYVQSNLGSLAALDAYSGAIAWLNIYPTDRPVEMPPFRRGPWGGGFGGNMPASMSNRSSRQPWSYNPVVVSEGHVFVMPTDCHLLLIYDAASGVEVKRIDLQEIDRKWRDRQGTSLQADALENIDTLLGVSGDRLVLAGKAGVVCLKWKQYDRRNFDMMDESSVFWVETLPRPLRGRGFLTSHLLFIPCADKLHCIDLRSGKSTDAYPRSQGWEDPEGPGNVIATSDHVIIAGANMVNVYTDLTMARTKLDREVASAPGDAQPRLRYAEVMLAAGESDLAIDKLDEAINLLGGRQAMRSGPARDRVFTDSLTFAQKLAGNPAPDSASRAIKLFDRAGSAAYSPTQQVHYRLARAKFEQASHKPQEAVNLYQQVLSDPAMRPIPMVDSTSGAPAQAAAVAESAIDGLIKSSPGVYDAIQQAATAALKTAQESGADSASKLLEVAKTYPNSTVAAKAMLAAADAYEAAGQARQAVQVLRQMWFKYPDSAEKARMLESMARNDFALPGRIEPGTAALARAATISADAKLLRPLKLPDGNVIEAATPLSNALQAVRKLKSDEPAARLPDFNVPIPPPRTPEDRAAGKKRTAFLPQSPQTTIDNIRSLVVPLRESARNDRVVVWTTDNHLAVYPAGQTAPLLSTDAFKEEPTHCAWHGDALIVWGPTQMMRVDVDSKSGDVVKWRVQVNGMPAIEVAKLTGEPQLTPRQITGDVFINGNQQVVVVPQVGPRRRGGRFVPQQNPLFNPAPPQRPQVSPTEQINEVCPVSDCLLISTTSGRLFAVDLADGHALWQVRLTDRPLNRIVANDDFTVVRLTDDTAVRLAALDTATGEIRGSKSFSAQNGNVPVNLALAPDGTLVYTLPDKLCLQDLYKPWTTDSDREVSSTSGAPPYVGAMEADQLVIADGRILALSDNGSEKYINLYSLETGQPITLRYRNPQGGNQEIDRRLTAGKSWNVTLRLVGPHLYVITPGQAFGYNLDKPEQTPWALPADSLPLVNVQEVAPGQRYLAVIEEETNHPARAPAGGNGAQPAANNAPAPGYTVYLFRRTSISATNPAESGVLDYQLHIADPAGILPTWQAVDGGLYFVTADNKLHMLKGIGETGN